MPVADKSGIAAVKDSDLANLAKTVLFEEPNVSIARNLGIAQAAGELVAFRGTTDMRDVLRDIDARLTPEGSGRVHRGFKKTLEPLWEELSAHLGKRPAWFRAGARPGLERELPRLVYRG